MLESIFLIKQEGHFDVMEYSYESFKIAIKAVHYKYKLQTVSVASAVTLLFNKDKKAIEKFLSE